MQETETALKGQFCGMATSLTQFYMNSVQLQRKSFLDGVKFGVERMQQFLIKNSATASSSQNTTQAAINVNLLMQFMDHIVQEATKDTQNAASQHPSHSNKGKTVVHRNQVYNSSPEQHFQQQGAMQSSSPTFFEQQQQQQAAMNSAPATTTTTSMHQQQQQGFSFAQFQHPPPTPLHTMANPFQPSHLFSPQATLQVPFGNVFTFTSETPAPQVMQTSTPPPQVIVPSFDGNNNPLKRTYHDVFVPDFAPDMMNSNCADAEFFRAFKRQRTFS